MRAAGVKSLLPELAEDNGYSLGYRLRLEVGRVNSLLPELAEDNGYSLGSGMRLEGGRGQLTPT